MIDANKAAKMVHSQLNKTNAAIMESRLAKIEARNEAETEFWHDLSHELKSHFKREERRHRREAWRDTFIVISLVMTIIYTVYVADTKTPEGLFNLVLNLVRGSV